jgi:hypothetical protein
MKYVTFSDMELRKMIIMIPDNMIRLILLLPRGGRAHQFAD